MAVKEHLRRELDDQAVSFVFGVTRAEDPRTVIRADGGNDE